MNQQVESEMTPEETEQAAKDERRSFAEHHGYKVQQNAKGGWEIVLPGNGGKVDCRNQDDGYEAACHFIKPSTSYSPMTLSLVGDRPGDAVCQTCRIGEANNCPGTLC